MRRAYLLRGPSRLIGHTFTKTKVGADWRSFLATWYAEFDWLEYSVEKDVAYCFYCFLSSHQALVYILDTMLSQKWGLRIGKKVRNILESI